MAEVMPKIKSCDVSNCTYNMDKLCHTCAITVGDGNCAMCDTFMQSNQRAGNQKTTGAVGACKMQACQYNKSLECTAGNIMVGMLSNHADCKTYAMR